MEENLLPLFPLEIVLLPEELLPLHIFEDRYKEMIGQCLEAKARGSSQQEFGVLLAREGETQMVGCTARIVNLTRKYDDGRMDILAVGRRRFEVLFTNEERAYLQGTIQFFEDDGADTPGEQEAQEAIELFGEVMRRLRESSDMPIHLPRPYRHLSFRVAAPLNLDVEFKQQLLTLRNEPDRLVLVTRVMHGLIERLDLVHKARAKAGGNGDMSSRK